MEILVLASTLEVGGGEMVLARLLGELKAAGEKVRVLLLKEPGPMGRRLLDAGHELESLHLARTRDPRILCRLARRIKRRPPGLLYVQDHHDCIFWGSLASALCGFIPVVVPVHSPGQRGASSFRRASRLLLGLGQTLATLGPWHGRALAREDGLAPGRWMPVPNPLDEEFLGSVSARESARPPLLGTVAALRPEKRQDRLLELFAALLRLRPARLRLVGDGPERARLEALAGQLGISPFVEFLGRREDVGRQLEELDLFLLTSEVEAQPLGLMEALAKGVPVAAPPHGGIPELLDGGRRGLILEGEDTAAWSRQVHELLEHPPSPAMREGWAREIRQEYSGERFARRYLSMIRQLGDG